MIASWPLALTVSAILLAQGVAPPVRTEAPARGELRPGERVLVDDGSCPAGQLREITGGGNAQQRGGGSQTAQPRQSRCIPRP
jgi:hypothetical protein